MTNPWTPGPWLVNGKGSIRGPNLSGRVLGWIAQVNWQNRQANARLIAAAPEMADELASAAAVFEHYAALHLAKGTPDGNEKAQANAKHAGRIRALLARIRGDAT
jgi:hypothetical protein